MFLLWLAQHPSQSIGAGGYGYVQKAVWNGVKSRMYVAVKYFFEDRADMKGGFKEEVCLALIFL